MIRRKNDTPRNIGKEVLQNRTPQVKPFITSYGRRIRPLHEDFDPETMVQEAENLKTSDSESDTVRWNQRLNQKWPDEVDGHSQLRDIWIKKKIESSILPPDLERRAKVALKRLYEILSSLPENKRPNFFLFPATIAPVLSYAVRPLLEKLGITVPFFAFPKTFRIHNHELDAEERWLYEKSAGKDPSKTAQEYELNPPQKPSFTEILELYGGDVDAAREGYRIASDAYKDRLGEAHFYLENKMYVETDLFREQLDYQVRRYIAHWHHTMGLPIEHCKPLIVDDFVMAESTHRVLQYSLLRSGIKQKNIKSFSFFSDTIPDDGVTRDLYGRERVHIGTFDPGFSFPFKYRADQFPPLMGIEKHRFIYYGTEKENDAFISLNSLQNPWSEAIAPRLNETARKNYAALMRGLRQKLRSMGEEIAGKIP